MLLGSWDPELARVIRPARIRRLARGGGIELDQVPAGLVAVRAVTTSGHRTDWTVSGADGRDREPCIEQWVMRS